VRAALLSLVVLVALAGCDRPTNHSGEAFTADGELIALSGGEGGARNACFACHGLDGAGDGVSAPRLAGLDAGYLQKQLDDYAADLRRDKTMTPVARWLDDEDRRAVAAYYAAMPPPTRARRA
jgi:cytochrome c553